MVEVLLAEEEEEEGSEGAGEPLILRIDRDDQGSVGSEDTSRFDSDEELAHPGEEGVPFLHLIAHVSSLHCSVWNYQRASVRLHKSMCGAVLHLPCPLIMPCVSGTSTDAICIPVVRQVLVSVLAACLSGRLLACLATSGTVSHLHTVQLLLSVWALNCMQWPV